MTNFASDTTEYTAAVANSVDEVTFTWTLTNRWSVIQPFHYVDSNLDDADGMEEGFQVELDVSVNPLGLYIFSEDNETVMIMTWRTTGIPAGIRAAGLPGTPRCGSIRFQPTRRRLRREPGP